MSKPINLTKLPREAYAVLAVLGAVALLSFNSTNKMSPRELEQRELKQRAEEILAQAKQYQLARSREAYKALSLYTDATDWQWLEEREPSKRRPSDLQWRIDEDNQYWLRRVYDGHWVKAKIIKDDKSNIQLEANAYWQADCAAGSEVVTSAKDSYGDNWSLKCVHEDWGSYLYVGALWEDGEVDDLPSWSTDYDGFQVREQFGSSYYGWDFDAAMKHLTLQGLSVPEPDAQP